MRVRINEKLFEKANKYLYYGKLISDEIQHNYDFLTFLKTF